LITTLLSIQAKLSPSAFLASLYETVCVYQFKLLALTAEEPVLTVSSTHVVAKSLEGANKLSLHESGRALVWYPGNQGLDLRVAKRDAAVLR
jgi:hypothetical protein